MSTDKYDEDDLDLDDVEDEDEDEVDVVEVDVDDVDVDDVDDAEVADDLGDEEDDLVEPAAGVDPLVADVEEEDDEDEDADDESDDVVEDEEEESLDVLLSREQSDDEDLVRLDDEPRDGLVTTIPSIGADEFTCRSCFLVKRRAQLADADARICVDCA